uniref:Uncharacterized protein n=1 Tax=viral metagenome TaxID=1070528 RepID=A0A6C0I2F7_9ZZZZ
MSLATIVTAYFRLPKSKASPEKYNEWMSNMLANSNPMVIFCDEGSKELILGYRNKYGYGGHDKTVIIVTTIKEFYSYQFAEHFVEHVAKDTERAVGHGPLLYMIWSEKSNFLKRAIELDPFKTDYFLWVDIGCFRVLNTRFLAWPNPDRIAKLDHTKVLLLSVSPFTEEELNCHNVTNLPLFQFKNRIGGTMFGGGKEVLLSWHQKYYDMLRTFIEIDRFIGKDQSIMNSVYLLNRDMCELVNWQQGCTDPWFYLQDYLE